jgi:anti-sigma factor RsiW
MDCTDVRERLVALDDCELGPSEAAIVERHLEGCLSCRGRRARLSAATPRASLVLSRQVRARLESLDGARVRASTPVVRERSRRILAVPLPLAVAWAFAFCLISAWGVANWWQRTGLEAQIAASSQRIEPVDGAIPADAYRPASWTPAEDPDYH